MHRVLVLLSLLLLAACNRAGTPCLDRPTEPARALPTIERPSSPLPVLPMDGSSEAAFRRSELPNPGRGLYAWLGQIGPGQAFPAPAPAYSSAASVAPFAGPPADDYRRLPWRWFYRQGADGRTTDEFDFSSLDDLLERVAAPGSGRKLHFGVMPVNGAVGDTANEPWWRGNSAMPDALRERLMAQNPPAGFYTTGGDRKEPGTYSREAQPDRVFWPDWNSEAYIGEAERFIEALAGHTTSLGVPLRDDPRLGGLEVRLYGQWGEWHTSGVDYDTMNAALGLNLRPGETDPEQPEGVRRRILEAYRRAFPKAQLVAMTGGQDNVPTLRWAFAQDARLGWRRDSFLTKLFDRHTDGGVRNGGFDFKDPLVRDRWMRAPVWVERGACGPIHTSLGVAQVEEFHVSAIGNQLGDKPEHAWAKVDAQRQQEWREAALRAGYRLIVSKLELPATAKVGSSFEVRATWENVGVAPLYEPFAVTFEFRKPGSSAPSWTVTSGFDLRTLLPASAEPDRAKQAGLEVSPFTARDEVRVPGGLELGRYELWVRVVDDASIAPGVADGDQYRRRPLYLAHEGRSGSGAYPMGSIALER